MMRIAIFSCCLFFVAKSIAQKSPYLLVGTYTSGKSEGIYVYRFNTKDTTLQLSSVAKTSNPSYLAIAPNKKTVYAVKENIDTTGAVVGGSISAFSFANGKLSPINEQLSGGKHPCYVAVDQSGQWVFSGNYTSGSLAVFPVTANGGILPASQVIYTEGSGPNKARQEGPHVHATVVSPDNKYLLVPNLGADKIFIFGFNKSNGQLTPSVQPFEKTSPGAGPRHFDFSPTQPFGYLMEELSGNVIAYRYKKGTLKKIQSISCLPEHFSGTIGAADIHVAPNGKFLYCSNRGDANNIAIFSIDSRNGQLTKIGHQSVLGKTPRNFTIDTTGHFLLVANQKSDEVVVFSIHPTTGLLTDTGKRITVPNPVCLKWID